jgi:GxxExxY protein
MSPHPTTPFSNLRFAVIGIAMKLQNRLGTAHKEQVYHKMFLAELQQAGYSVESEPQLQIRTATGDVAATYRPDFRLVHEAATLLIEIKADPDGLQTSHRRQAQAYLSVDQDARAVLLINFARRLPDGKGKRSLEWAVIFRKDL